jgi:hypothetical protein
MLEVIKRAFDYDFAFAQKSQAVGNSSGTMQIVSYDNGRHLMLSLELQNQVVDFP